MQFLIQEKKTIKFEKKTDKVIEPEESLSIDMKKSEKKCLLHNEIGQNCQ